MKKNPVGSNGSLLILVYREGTSYFKNGQILYICHSKRLNNEIIVCLNFKANGVAMGMLL